MGWSCCNACCGGSAGSVSGSSAASLLAGIAAGERDALRRLYQDQSQRLFGIADAILRDREAAADALLDAFLTINRQAAQFDPVRGEAGTWLASITRHAALDLARRRGREVPTDLPAPDDGLEALAASRDGARLRRCLEALDERNRRGILLAYVHGLSHAQVAAKLDLPQATVRAWIRRGLVQLRECLA